MFSWFPVSSYLRSSFSITFAVLFSSFLSSHHYFQIIPILYLTISLSVWICNNRVLSVYCSLPLSSPNHCIRIPSCMGRYGSGGKSYHLGYRFDPTLGVSKCPWARHLSSLVPCQVSQSPLVCGRVCEWMNERHKLYSAVDKGAI